MYFFTRFFDCLGYVCLYYTRPSKARTNKIKFKKKRKKKDLCQDLPDDPAVKILRSQCRGLGSIPGQGTRFSTPQLKSLHIATKTQCSQIKKEIFLNVSFNYRDTGV